MNEIHRKTVLFLCMGNSVRSQMAEALLCLHAGPRFEALSAGAEPKGVHPMVRTVLEEAGINIDRQHSKRYTAYLERVPVHTVIVMRDYQEQFFPPSWPGACHELFWVVGDPTVLDISVGEKLEEFRRTRDRIERLILDWLGRDQAELWVA